MKRGIQNILINFFIWFCKGYIVVSCIGGYFGILNDFELLECSSKIWFDSNSTLIFMAFLNKITTWAIKVPIYEWMQPSGRCGFENYIWYSLFLLGHSSQSLKNSNIQLRKWTVNIFFLFFSLFFFLPKW